MTKLNEWLEAEKFVVRLALNATHGVARHRGTTSSVLDEEYPVVTPAADEDIENMRLSRIDENGKFVALLEAIRKHQAIAKEHTE